MMRSERIIACAVLLAATVHSTSAHAACVQGSLRTWWEVSGFCDWGERDCTGWWYTDGSQNTTQPLREMKLEIWNSANTSRLAVGATSNLGNYSICYSGSPSSVRLKMNYTQASDAFSIRTSTGGLWSSTCTLTGLGSGTNTRDCTWGSDNAPHAQTSVYEQAYASLQNIVKPIFGTQGPFTNVQIRMDSSATNSWGYDKIIRLQDSNEFNWVVPHEIGHVVSALASPGGYMGTDDSNKGAGIQYDACGGDGAMQYTTTNECRDAVWTEAIAEVMRAWAVQTQNSASPCTGNQHSVTELECMFDGFNLESVPSCASRMRLTDAVRYKWDLFDATGSDGVTISKSSFGGALGQYYTGRINHAKDENWCCAFWSCYPCNHDGKNMGDFAFHINRLYGKETSGLMATNCSN